MTGLFDWEGQLADLVIFRFGKRCSTKPFPGPWDHGNPCLAQPFFHGRTDSQDHMDQKAKMAG